MNLLRYRGFEGSAEVDLDRGVCAGKLLFIDDLITYEAPDPRALKSEFEAAVDDYIETCEQLGREPKKPHSGVFNVRTTPQKHRELALRAAQSRSTLNAVVNEALDVFLNQAARDQREVLRGYSSAYSAVEEIAISAYPSARMVLAHAETASPSLVFSDAIEFTDGLRAAH